MFSRILMWLVLMAFAAATAVLVFVWLVTME